MSALPHFADSRSFRCGSLRYSGALWSVGSLQCVDTLPCRGSRVSIDKLLPIGSLYGTRQVRDALTVHNVFIESLVNVSLFSM